MHKRTFAPLPQLLILCLLLWCSRGMGQSKYDAISFKIDSLASSGMAASALKKVDQLAKLAKENKNAPQQIKAAIYRMTFQSYLQEDALSAVISGLRADIAKSAYPVTPVLQSVLAEMYWKYYEQNRYRFAQRSRLLTPDTDFTQWDLQTLISQATRLYQLSLSEAAREQNTPIAVLEGVLEGDTSTRYLRPSLYDLLLQRALDFFLSDEPALTKPRMPFSLSDPAFFSDSRAFAALVVRTSDTASSWYQGIRYLQQATAFHLKMDHEEALADIGLQRLKFLHDKSGAAHQDSLYVGAVKQIATAFAARPISSEALVLLGQYYASKDSLVTARNYYSRAISAWPQSLGANNAAWLLKIIDQKNITATVEQYYSPGKPLLALLGYKNITSASIRIYRLTQAQNDKYLNDYAPRQGMSYSQYRYSILAKLKPVQQQTLQWTGSGDFRNHTAEFKIASLPPGNYVLVAGGGASDDLALTVMANFSVSAMACMVRGISDDNKELLVTDRQTGAPLQGVSLALSGETYSYKDGDSHVEKATESGTTNARGVYTSKKISFSRLGITLTAPGDTLVTQTGYIPSNDYDSDEEDEPEDQTILFTDRQIYRPGQTIYFKGLQLQTFKGKSKILPGKNLTVTFTDVNNKQVSSQLLRTNEFGTLSGSFVIPQTMLGGNVTIKTVAGEIGVKVEEYKRPTFQVEFLPVKESYRISDSVTVKGTVTAYSGYGLSQAKVAYQITRNESFDYRYMQALYGSRGRYNYNYQSAEIKSDTITTDQQGNYAIRFKAAPDENGKYSWINYRFTIKADVTDASGETHSGEATIVVGNNDVLIAAELPEQVFAKDTVIVPVRINNLNGQAQKGHIKVRIYALESPRRLFKNRLWAKPDEHILSAGDFKNDFPEYAFGSQDEPASWKRLKELAGLDIGVDENKAGTITLEALRKEPSGMYQVVISARNEKGDTSSLTKYIELIASSPLPALAKDWVIPVQNEVKPGLEAKFLAGTGENINVLVERYNGPRLVSSKWVNIKKGQQSFKFAVSEKDKDPAVQFLAIYGDRVYSSYQKIYVVNPDKMLKLKLLTYRNKLQPGQKEQWKLQVTDQKNERQSAEMVATLYDASLDELTEAQSWRYLSDPEEKNSRTDYFAWSTYEFVRAQNSIPVNQAIFQNGLFGRDYQKLRLFGYNYYGGNNNGYQQYLKKARQNVANAQRDKQLENEYLKNAAKVKGGYDVTGRIIDPADGSAIPGAAITIRGTSIGTLSNSEGYFKIRVPADGVIVVSYLGYLTQSVSTSKSENLTIKLNPTESHLNEVVVVGYGSQRKKDVSGAVVYIRGASSLYGSSAGLEDPLQAKAPGVTVMEGAPVTYKEVRIEGAENLKARRVTIRKNFNETAFFYPQLHTDSEGKILIDFTIPEALTKWRFKAFAHTRELKTGYLQSDIVTQKQLNISANMPRFMREGDTITVSARLANLSSEKLKGQASIQFFNALNMQPVSLLADPGEAKQPFELAASATGAVSFKLVVPQNLDAMTYRLTADAGNYSDGEENTLPVLAGRMLVNESMPMMIRAGQTRTFTFDKLLRSTSATLKSKSLTLEFTQNPAWYAVQALPYMMEFPYECSEQVFSRYYANSLATNLVSRMPVIKRVFDQWKSSNSTALLSNLETNQELKSTLLEETPWLRQALSESEQKKRIALLFDLNKMSSELQSNLDKLQHRQLPDGGFTWFGGSQADRYITQHIIAGIGKLYHLHIPEDKSGQLQVVADNAIGYMDKRLIEEDSYAKLHPKYESRDLDPTEIHAWYARSYFPDEKMSEQLKKAFASYLQRAEKQWLTQNIYEQGMIALTMLRSGKPLVATAIISSLKESAQASENLGMYWGKNLQGYFWYESPVETQCLLIELFTESGGNEKAVEEMKIWLLRNKQTSDWKTTKATAAACYALLIRQADWLESDASADIKLGGQALEELKPGIKAEAGTGYIKTSWADEQINKDMGKVEIKNSGKSISWGALHWQYLEQLDKITPSSTDIQLERKYFILKQTGSGPALTPVDADHQPKTGDLLKVVVHLKSGRDFEYVQLKDMRPAGTEPLSVLSEYKYQDGLSYYQVTRDVATNFFISYLNKGSYVFEYQLRVAQAGNFSTGISSIQCMYAPEFNAHSQGTRVTFKP